MWQGVTGSRAVDSPTLTLLAHSCCHQATHPHWRECMASCWSIRHCMSSVLSKVQVPVLEPVGYLSMLLCSAWSGKTRDTLWLLSCTLCKCIPFCSSPCIPGLGSPLDAAVLLQSWCKQQGPASCRAADVFLPASACGSQDGCAGQAQIQTALSSRLDRALPGLMDDKWGPLFAADDTCAADPTAP